MDAHGATYLAKVKKQNRNTILAFLKESHAHSVAETASATGLSIATCATALAEMVNCGEALVLEEKKSQGGRPARRFAFNPDQILVAAIFLGVSHEKESLRFTVANANHEIVDSGGENKSRITLRDIDELITRLSDRHPKLRAVAVSVPGVVKNGTVDFCDIPALAGVRLEERIRTTFGLEAVADNDINFAAAGFFKKGGIKGLASLVYMAFPDHIYMGAGVIVNGSVVRGRTSFAGELSFIPFEEAKKGRTRLMPRPENFVQYVSKLSVTVTAVIDPDVIVLEGNSITPEMCDAIGDACLDHIPAEHLPEFVIRKENDGDSLAGMVAMAVDAYLQHANTEKD